MGKRSKTSIYWNYLFRFLVVLAGTYIVMVSFTLFSLRKAYSQVIEVTEYSIKNVIENFNSQLLTFQEQALAVGGISELLPYKINQNLPFTHNITKELRKIKSVGQGVETLGLHYRRSPYGDWSQEIFTNSGRYTLDEFAAQVCKGKISAEKLSKELSTVTYPTFLSSISTESKPDTSEILLLLIPTAVAEYSPSVMIYELNYMNITTQVNVVGTANSMIVDIDNNPLCYVENLPSVSYKELLGYINGSQSMKRDFILTKQSKSGSYTIVSLYNRADFFKGYYTTAFLYLLLFLLVLGLGSIFSVRFAKRNFEPIEALIRDLPSNNQGGNELRQLSSYLETVRNENSMLSLRAHDHSIHIRNQFLQAMVLGKIDMDNMRIAEKKLLEKTIGKSEKANVLIFSFNDIVAYPTKELRKDRWLLKYAVSNMFEDLPNNKGEQYALDLAHESGIICVMFWKNDEDAIDQTTRDIGKYVIDLVYDIFETSMSCYISDDYSIGEIYHAYDEVNLLMEYGAIFESRSVLTQKDAALRAELLGENLHLKQSEEYVGLLEKLLEHSHRKNKTEVIEQFSDLIRQVEKSKDTIHFYSFYNLLVFTLNQVINNFPLSHREEIKYKISLLYVENTSPDSMLKALSETLLVIFNDLQEAKSEDTLYQSLMDYVHSHYIDNNLTLSEIAEHIGLTPSYVTSYFKENNGVTLMQYVAQYRITKAKEILASTNMPIKEIVVAVGYMDESNFSRSFRKYEGCSPSNYRRQYRKKGI